MQFSYNILANKYTNFVSKYVRMTHTDVFPQLQEQKKPKMALEIEWLIRKKSPNKHESVQTGLYLLLNLQTSSPLTAWQHDVLGHVPEAYFK